MDSFRHGVLRTLYLLSKVWAKVKKNTFRDVNLKIDHLPQRPECTLKGKKQKPRAHRHWSFGHALCLTLSNLSTWVEVNRDCLPKYFVDAECLQIINSLRFRSPLRCGRSLPWMALDQFLIVLSRIFVSPEITCIFYSFSHHEMVYSSCDWLPILKFRVSVGFDLRFLWVTLACSINVFLKLAASILHFFAGEFRLWCFTLWVVHQREFINKTHLFNHD